MVANDNSKVSTIRRYLSQLFKPEELVEYRAKVADGGMRGFYFTDLQRLAEVVAALDSDGRASVSYVCINPLKGRLIRERGLLVNPTDEQVQQIIDGPAGQTAHDEDIAEYRWMFVDVDTIRVPHLREADKKEFDRLQHECSTDEEKARARTVAQKVLAFLGEKGWPQPILADSGNGFHILFRTNLQNTLTNKNHIADCLKALKAKFANEPDADIDSSVYNPARLTRAYGSTTRKGTDTPERPYRRNRIFEMKQPVGDVTLDMILNLAVASPAYNKHSDGDMPELDPSFDPHEWVEWYKKQGAFHVEGDKEWQGHPILATDFCLYAGRKHSGDEFKSGFIIGDTFGYRCFSDECDGKTIKEIYKWLREAVDDQGNPLYTPFPKPIYKTETLEELRGVFEWQDLNDLDKEHEAEVAAQSVDAPAPEPTLEPGEPEVNKNRIKVGRIKDLAGWMIGTVLRDPVEVVPKFKQLKQRLEHTIIVNIEAPIREAIGCLLGYFEDTNHLLLPNKNELLSWINETTHPAIAKFRKLKYFGDISAYIADLQDDPSKEFTAVVTELDRATTLAAQRESTKANYKRHLNEAVGDGDVQAFRIAERKFAQKEFRLNGDIVGKPLQMVTDVISDEFRKDVDGVNDAGKFELGFPAIDEHSHIGLNGERTIYIYGPANVGKTTLLMTWAVNAAMMGKNILILIGEHQAIPMMKTLTLMLGSFVKDDPEIGVLPDRDAWEGINRTATMEDWERINKLLEKVRDRLLLPGLVSVENISAIARAEEDRLGACIDHIQGLTYPLDAVFIDPLDQVMPLSAMGRDNAWEEGVEVLQRIQGLSRNFEGRNGKGLMIISSVQFKSSMQREIEKNQAKTAIGDNMDDVILSLMSQMSQVQFYTTIPQHADCMIGIVTRLKGGNEGYLVHGRFRFGSTFKNVGFVIDPVAHIITTKGPATYVAPNARAAAAPDGRVVAEQSMEPYDIL